MKLAHLFESAPVLLMEVKARIEHPEDLIWDSGSAGVTQALQILQTSAQRPEQVTIKFDGSPALVAGWRDGEFMLTDKAGFSAKGYDGLTTSQQDLESMILNRKIKLDTPEAKAARQSYAHKIASLYPLLKQVIPASLKGYVQGDLLWTQTPDIKQGAYVFKPNKISYAVPVNSELGKQIGASKVGIVFHSKLASPADDDADALRDPAALGIRSTPDVVVVPHEMQFKKPFKLNAELVKKVQQLVHAHGVQIDQLLDGAQLADRQIKALPQVMKAYLAHKAGEGATDLSDAAEDFIMFIQSAKSKLSVKAQHNISEWIESHVTAYRAIWQIVQLLVQIKLDLKRQMDVNVGDKVKAQLGDAPGHEGFVSVTDAGIIKLVNRAQFMKKDAPITEHVLNESDTPRRVVFTYARMNPPTLGHRMLVDKMKSEAGNDDYWVFLSHSRDPKLNPLTWEQKVQFVKQIMKPHAAHVISDPSVKLLFKTFKWLYDQGYRDINMVVGSDRVADMTQRLQTWNSDEKRIPDGRDRVIVKVINAGQRDPDSDEPTPGLDKPTTVADTPVAATPTPDLDKPTINSNKPDPKQVNISAISGTKARKAVEDGDLPAFEKFTGLTGTMASRLFDAVKSGMHTVKVKPNSIKEQSGSGSGHIVMLNLSNVSSQRLSDWCRKQDVRTFDPDHMHMTVMCTESDAAHVMDLDGVHTQIHAQPVRWEVLGSALALVCACADATRLHDKLRATGCDHKWSDLLPHVSVNYDWDANNFVPRQLPQFDLTFDSITAEPADPQFAKKVMRQ
jgi:hypothetical protein